ncbi:hypothetical protein HUK80_17535 [Flavobacterium sp. MAH-1]|uniref:Uncharacterized protein n=1 Tax=Flavobacterium agri TaxID=2743471 RepID=A0A7Y8Y559_9FLAO|nr:hypothetical protein [Flavobacterium agri]NUY82709.1 hypothetical protein [Flavobacterium agri]NYA72732.1 hypothetical protein [Flavobacterium agri]
MENNENLVRVKTLSTRINNDFVSATKLNPRINIEGNLKSRKNKLSKLLHENLQDYLDLYDEAIRLTICSHELFKEHFPEKSTPSFVVLTAKMVTLMLGIKQMLEAGFSDCVKNLERPLIEANEVFFACLIDPELSKSFSSTSALYDNDKFYWENFSKGKLDKQCQKLYEKIELKKEDIENLNLRKSALKKFLSESIHSSFNAAFSSYLMMSIDFKIEDNIYGKVTTAYPRLLISLIEETHLFNNLLNDALDKKVCPELEGIETLNSYKLYKFYNEKFHLLFHTYYLKLEEDSKSYSKFFEDIRAYLESNNGT